MSSKRLRAASPSQASSSASQPSSEATEPVSKATRTTSTSSSARPLLCTLPPTCNPPHQPTTLANSKELETHYATYHAHVCEYEGCGCVFPDARLLELHQTECHDPIAALRKERGEKIVRDVPIFALHSQVEFDLALIQFACHLATCPRIFSTPKTRRLHLIQSHGYPKEYFFAVTNKGVGGLLKKWGEGASMIRGTWSARGENDGGDDDVQEETESTTEPLEQGESASSHRHDGPLVEDDDDDDDDLIGETPEASVDDLAQSMGTLSLVPTAVRFGRGAKRGGTTHYDAPSGSRGHHPRYTTTQHDGPTETRMEVDPRARQEADNGRGRGRGRPPFPMRGIPGGRRGMIFGRGRIAMGRGGGRGGRGRGVQV
ncbi:hypothetical protein BDY19DRAFT_622474 [Irpex rosettiformis]|uniref:Uncharacterized protein n=1 Tax=Irpex rosettiformis TaxID=378272 RepID=A0ACB8UAL5_9APHY|nr:hypothetical protein BDY19DRAFT_622474 [Irpex rosettiformis]